MNYREIKRAYNIRFIEVCIFKSLGEDEAGRRGLVWQEGKNAFEACKKDHKLTGHHAVEFWLVIYSCFQLTFSSHFIYSNYKKSTYS